MAASHPAITDGSCGTLAKSGSTVFAARGRGILLVGEGSPRPRGRSSAKGFERTLLFPYHDNLAPADMTL